MKPYFTLANLALITLAIYFGVDGFYTVLESRMGIESPLAAAGLPPEPAPRPEPAGTLSLSPKLERDLFHTGEAQAPPSPVDLAALKETRLKVKLLGTIVQEGGFSYAVIESPGQRDQKLYQTGDQIESALLKMILREKVILNVNGQDEVLEMEKPDGNGRGGIASRRHFSPPTPPAYLPDDDLAPPDLDEETPSRIQRLTLQKSQFEDLYRDLSDPHTPLQVKIEPYMQDGVPSGIILSRILPNSVFSRLGLRNGDVVSQINDMDISSPEDVVKVYENLLTAEEFSIQVNRRGRVERFEYNIE